MERRSFIKNTFGAIIGYALLPKVLTQAKETFTIGYDGVGEQLLPGLAKNVFTIRLDKSWFNQGDIIKAADHSEYLLNEKTEYGFKGIGLIEGQFYSTIEIIDYKHSGLTLIDTRSNISKVSSLFEEAEIV